MDAARVDSISRVIDDAYPGKSRFFKIRFASGSEKSIIVAIKEDKQHDAVH